MLVNEVTFKSNIFEKGCSLHTHMEILDMDMASSEKHTSLL